MEMACGDGVWRWRVGEWDGGTRPVSEDRRVDGVWTACGDGVWTACGDGVWTACGRRVGEWDGMTRSLGEDRRVETA